MKILFRLLLLIAPMVLMSVLKTDAQANEREVIVMEVSRDGALTFYAVNSNGAIREIGSLPDEFHLPNEQILTSGSWSIEQVDELALAPNHEYVAFSARQHTGNESVYRLFVYRLSGEEVWSALIDDYVQISWSPTSLGFGFSPANSATGANDEGIAYFRLGSQSVTLLKHLSENEFAYRFRSIEDETFIYSLYAYSLEMLTLDGESTSLFNREEIQLEGVLDSLCDREWSRSEQMIFLSIGCTSAPESIILEVVYGISVDGTLSLLLEPPPEFEDEGLHVGAYRIENIEIVDGTAYIVTWQYRQNFNQEDNLEETSQWDVLKFQNGSLTPIFSSLLEQPTPIKSPVISPNGRYITFGLNTGSSENMISKLMIFDLVNGSFVREIETSGGFGWRMKWLNNYTFLYVNAHSRSQCQCTDASLGNLSLLVDLSQYAVTDIGAEFEHPIWLFEE